MHFILHCQSVTEGNQSGQDRAQGRDHGRTLFTGLLLVICCTIQYHLPWSSTALIELSTSTSITNQKNALHVNSPIYRNILNRESFFSNDSSMCQVDKTNKDKRLLHHKNLILNKWIYNFLPLIFIGNIAMNLVLVSFPWLIYNTLINWRKGKELCFNLQSQVTVYHSMKVRVA